MCNAAVSGFLGMGMQAYSMQEQAKAAERAKAQAEQNKVAAGIAAVQSKEQASYEASRLQMRADQLVSHIRNTVASQYGDLSRGTPVRLASDVRVVSEIDKQMVILRGAQKAAGYIMQGDTFSAQAAAAADAAQAAYVTGFANMLYQGTSWWASSNYDQGAPPNQPATTSGLVAPVEIHESSLGDWTIPEEGVA